MNNVIRIFNESIVQNKDTPISGSPLNEGLRMMKDDQLEMSY